RHRASTMSQAAMIIRPERSDDTAAPASYLYSHNILAGLPAECWRRLRREAKSVWLKEGDALFLVGDPADGCYWLRTGIVKASVASQRGDERILAILGPGSIVGELAFLDDRPRVVNVHALKDCQLLRIGNPALNACLREYPEAYDYLLRALT